MAVPISGSFEMFGTGSSTTIAGALAEGGSNVTGVSTFNDLINLANSNYFDSAYSGVINNPTTDVSSSLQFKLSFCITKFIF